MTTFINTHFFLFGIARSTRTFIQPLKTSSVNILSSDATCWSSPKIRCSRLTLKNLAIASRCSGFCEDRPDNRCDSVDCGTPVALDKALDEMLRCFINEFNVSASFGFFTLPLSEWLFLKLNNHSYLDH